MLKIFEVSLNLFSISEEIIQMIVNAIISISFITSILLIHGALKVCLFANLINFFKRFRSFLVESFADNLLDSCENISAFSDCDVDFHADDNNFTTLCDFINTRSC